MKKWLLCDVDENGNESDYGIPTLTRNQDDIKEVYYLFGLQFGWALKMQKDGTVINQYSKKFHAVIPEQ